MPMETFKAIAKSTGGLSVEAESRGFKLIIDEPIQLGGTNTGMNPVELLLCSLGACQTIAASAFAPHFEIELEEFWTEVEGDLDTDGFMGLNDEVRKGYQDIRFNFHIKSNASEERIHQFVKFVENTCPVGDTINGGVKLGAAKITIEK
ncbi:OsmC family protein [Clostridium sp. DL1XJH146]